MAVKKTREKKNAQLDKIREYGEMYPLMAIIENPSIPNTMMKRIREDFNDTKILFIKRKVIKAVYNISISSESFLMFGNEESIASVGGYQYQDFLDVGDICPTHVVVEKQIIRNKEMIDLLPVSIRENQMHLDDDYTICEANDVVDEKKVKILRFFGQRLKSRNLIVSEVMKTSLLKRTTDD